MLSQRDRQHNGPERGGPWISGTAPQRRGSLCSDRRMEGARVPQLACRNAYGEHLLEPGRVNDCYLAILLNQPLADIAPEPGRCSCRFRRAAARGDPPVRRPVLCDLVTGHPDRQPGGLVFLADLTDELRAWPQQTWTVVGISPEAALLAIVDCWRYAHVKGCTWAG